MQSQNFKLPEKPFLTIDEAAIKLGCSSEKLLEYAYFREAPEGKFGKLRVHAIISAEVTENAKKSFTSYDQASHCINDFIGYENPIDLIDTLKRNQLPELEQQLAHELQGEYENELDEWELSAHDTYHPEITRTPRDFVLLDIGSLIELINLDTLDIAKAYIERFDNQLVQLNFINAENRTQISKNNLRILVADLGSLIKIEAVGIESENAESINPKEKSFLLAMIGALILDKGWKLQDVDLAKNIEKIANLHNYSISERTIKKHIKELNDRDGGFKM